MREVPRDQQFEELPSQELTGELISAVGLSDLVEIMMLQTALLMRIYDAQMETLAAADNTRAKMLWALHEKGGHKNPPTMVPVFEREDEEQD